MTPNRKHISLFLLMGSLLSLVLLAASLPNLQLEPSSALPANPIIENTSPTVSTATLTPAYFSPLLRGIFALVFLALVIYLPARLLAFVDLKKVFQVLLVLILFITIAYLLPLMAPSQPPTFPAAAAAQAELEMSQRLPVALAQEEVAGVGGNRKGILFQAEMFSIHRAAGLSYSLRLKQKRGKIQSRCRKGGETTGRPACGRNRRGQDGVAALRGGLCGGR